MEMSEMLQQSSGALFSKDRKYRYRLWRRWDFNKPMVMFIGLNPSTANETSADKTVTRVIEFARIWGYGGIYMMNLFAYVSTDPDGLVTDDYSISENNRHLRDVRKLCKDVVFCWGGFKVLGRDEEVMKMFPGAFALKINADGSPRHPLYVNGDTRFIPYLYKNKQDKKVSNLTKNKHNDK